MARTVLAFDLYGTLISTDAITQELSKWYGEETAETVAAQARRYQLEYTWRLNSMGISSSSPSRMSQIKYQQIPANITSQGIYQSFSDLTRSSFQHATAELDLAFGQDVEDSVMKAYDELDTYSDVKQALRLLSEAPDLEPYIFSNGTVEMLTSSLKRCPGLSLNPSVFSTSKIVSVDDIQVFKPHPNTYTHLIEAAGMRDETDRVWLISSNPFDIVGARYAGLSAAWVDRTGKGWIDGLGALTTLRPTIVAKGVDEAVAAIQTSYQHGGVESD